MSRRSLVPGWFVVIALAISCNEKDAGPPTVIGVWVFMEKELSSCADPSMNKIETCTKGCYSYRFGKSGIYTIYNGAGASVDSGFYRIEDNKIVFRSGDYEFTVTETTLTMIQQGWPVYNGTSYVYCNQYERYSRQ